MYEQRLYSELLSTYNYQFQEESRLIYQSLIGAAVVSQVQLNRRHQQRSIQVPQPHRPASRQAVDRLALVKIDEKNLETQQADPQLCSICQENISVGTDAMSMPCKHLFHPHCLRQWLESNYTCPECRCELPQERNQ